MPSTTEATREELVAEYVIRDAVNLVENRIRHTLEGEELDICARLDALQAVFAEDLLPDPRREALFEQLYPGEDDGPDDRAGAETCRIAAKILRSIAYHAEYLRGEAQRLFELAEKDERAAQAASVDA